MSGSQKVLRVFGVLELIGAILGVVGAVMGGAAAVSWTSVVVSLLAAYLLLAAAKDASKIGGAWIWVLVSLILSIADLGFAISGGGDAAVLIAPIIALVLNLIAFIAANNVKKQYRKGK